MPFLDRDEIARSLTGAWRVFLDKADAAGFFDLTVSGFWRSFRAIVLMIPSEFTFRTRVASNPLAK